MCKKIHLYQLFNSSVSFFFQKMWYKVNELKYHKGTVVLFGVFWEDKDVERNAEGPYLVLYSCNRLE